MALIPLIKQRVQLAGQIQGQAAGLIKIDPEPLKKLALNLVQWQKDQIPFATALAITKTAQRVQKAEIEWMQSGFIGGAVPFTLKSLFLKRADKNNLAKGARVWFKDYASKGTPAGEYLKPQVQGGPRKAKPGEKAIRSRHKLQAGRFLVPGRFVPKDSFGNVRGVKATMQKVLANIRGGRDATTDTKKGRKTGYFIGVPRGRGGPSGIWERRNKKLRLWAVETGEPQYREKFDFFGISDKVVEQWYDYEFKQALGYALRTAKK